MLDLAKAVVISAMLMTLGFVAIATAAILVPVAVFVCTSIVVWILIRINAAGEVDPKNQRDPKD